MAKKKSAKGKKPPPKCKAILICDQVIVDALSRKHSVIGVFETFFAPGFPGLTPSFFAFVQMVDGIGTYQLTIEVHDLDENSVIARMGVFPIEFPERVNKANFVCNILPFPLPHAGVYDLVVLADGQEIDRQKFEARLPPTPQGDPGHDPDRDDE
jgi:hypothetical protein